MSDYPKATDNLFATSPVATSPRDNPSLARNVEKAFQAIEAVQHAVGTWDSGIIIYNELSKFVLRTGDTFTGEVIFNEGLTSHNGVFSPIEKNPAALGNEYPYGLSHMGVLQEDGWPAGGLVTTVRTESNVMQWLSSGQYEQFVRWGLTEWTEWQNFARDPNAADKDHNHDDDYAYIDHDHPLPSHNHSLPSHNHPLPSHEHNYANKNHEHDYEEGLKPSDLIRTGVRRWTGPGTVLYPVSINGYINVPTNWNSYDVFLGVTLQVWNTDTVGHALYWRLQYDKEYLDFGNHQRMQIVEAGPTYHREVTLCANGIARNWTTTGNLKRYTVGVDSVGATNNVRISHVVLSIQLIRTA